MKNSNKTKELMQEEKPVSTPLNTEEELKVAKETIEDLNKELTSKELKAVNGNVVMIDGVKYEITIPRFNYKGTNYTAADVIGDKKLAKELLEFGFGGLKKV